ncbi:E3 ubiquitin-protein ligase SHPRH isoform X1 [Solanum tuberosum]|uniref:E3 ubiquitin-protein ligase SHPRH isoform X1 n=1 Tax=Solanum tuberosum TaxID=4113 RepID=UPI0003D25DF6|nr:PREDICTED: E3 ubiquitin-protein ligase SHPRH isoform X1 [Solanum tuberosum]KAH0704372.1 hypothetical protein KY285_018650 [Solanum tuberosum]
MGRRKSKPKRSVGILEGEVPKGKLNGKTDAGTAEKDESFAVDVPFFVEIDRSNWLSDQHMDISEIVLSDLNVSDEFGNYVLDEEFYRDSRYLLRFRVSNVNDHLTRIKLGHWPVLSATGICLEIVAKQEKEGLEEKIMLVEGNFDGPDEGISGLVHLASLKFFTLRPVIVPSCLASIRIRVEILKSAFDACESLLDTSRQLWKKSMMNVMAWLRPEVVTAEARYGYQVAAPADIGLASGLDESSSAARKLSRFDVASFYEAIKPSKEEPMLDDDLPGLLPKLRPYQRRAAYWMVQREKRNSDGSLESKINHFISPLCMPLSLIDTSITIYYNPFGGNVSLRPESAPPVVPGGILADEMGLGKTVELLACIFTHQVASSFICNFTGEFLCDEGQKNSLKRLKRERVECICGSVSESIRYKGLWVQCDACDAWQHADCVGYSANKRYKKSKAILTEQQLTGNMHKHAKRKNGVKIVEMEDGYICQPCSELIQACVAPVASGATLIVCPAPILPQWHAEIVRHTSPGAMKTCIYEGVRNNSLSQTPLPDINELLNANIVLTTYDVLKEDLSHDSDRHEGDRRALRFEKRYPVIPTLLTRILWWRICLDEAQMVENNAAAATEMALRLHGVHRWCITGTPIQRKLDDLFGLLRFLNASPFYTLRWWTDVIRDPYERGDSRAMTFTHDFFKHLMWRSSKVHVADELQLPPQEECVSWLSLSPIEEHFYQRQHDTCVNDARELTGSLKNDIYKRKIPGSQLEDAASDVVITNIEAAKLFNSLLKLRQACCHPQVGSSGLRSLQQSPMTMEEILSVLVSKTKVEGEEALRRLVVALNALAGIAIINQNYTQAVSLYQEALALAEDHFEDFRLDPLLNIHITHNLSEVLPLSSDSSQKLECACGSTRGEVSNIEDAEESDKGALFREDKVKEESLLLTNSDGPSNLMSNSLENDSVDENSVNRLNFLSKCTMTIACKKLKEKFLSVFNLKLAGAQQEFKKSYDQVCNAFSDRKNQYTAWWLEALHHIEQNKDSSNELIRKIGEAVSGTLNTSRASKVASCFHSITALKIYIQSGLDSLERSRESLLVKLLEIDQTMGNPRKEDIARVRYCPKCYADSEGVLCVHCELNDLFQVYEARLFRLNKGKSGEVITSAEEAVDLQKKKSQLNRFYTTLARTDRNSGSATIEYEDFGKKRDLENIVVSKAPSDLEVVLVLIKSNSRGLLDAEGVSAARKQLQLLEGMRKEYAQARLLATAQAHVLRAHDEIMMATSRLRLKEDENDKSIDALDPGELDAANAEWSSEKFLFLSSLSRIKGQLRYLKGLVQSKQTNHLASSENSNVTQATIVAAAHAEEKKEYQAITEEDTCPVCQEKLNNQKMVFQCGHVICCNCLFAMTEKRLALHGKPQFSWLMCPTCRQHTDCRNIAYAVDRRNMSCPSSSIVSENSEASTNVQGSYSTKIEAVTRRILWITSTNPVAKVLVFSSWNDVLDVLEHAFAANNITFVRMKGGRKSHVAISQFRGHNNNVEENGKRHVGQPETRSIQVLLLLIQHGANGLNLLEAQHVILVEPLLNPAAEAQAIGRVHRIGQAHKTLVHRFIVKDTVEESIYKLNKSRNTGSFVSGNRKNQDQPILTLRDVESLFRVAPAPSIDEEATESLTHFPPSVAAAIAAERRLREQTSGQEPQENC